MLLLWKGYLLKKISKKMLIIIVAVAVAVPLLYFLLSHLTAGGIGEWLEAWLYAIQVGNVERSLYSERFPLPIFYLIEMTYPYSHIHPVSLPLYIISLCGLGFWLWRRKTEDKFALIWFLVVYIVFTLIPNRNWRYVLPLFPILALSATDFLFFLWDKIKAKMVAPKTSLQKSVFIKILAVVFVVLIGASAVYSWSDAYSWVEQDHVHIPIGQSTQYVIENSAPTESIVVLFPGNYFSVDMVKFYLLVYDSGDHNIWPYPEAAVDAFSPELNVTFLIERCESTNVKYLMLYEYGNITYFDSDWKSYDVFDMLTDSGRFTSETVFGTYPRRVTILQFISDS
jgi:hypothetical protein